MDGPKDVHAEWSKSEREKQILCVNAYMWNLEKWYRWTYLQSRNKDTDLVNKCSAINGEDGEWNKLEDGVNVSTLLCIKYENLLHSTGNSMLCGELIEKAILF